MIFHIIFIGVVMIRCDIHKGKLRFGNFIEAGRDAQPRKDEGLVVDHGNVGKFLWTIILDRKYEPMFIERRDFNQQKSIF